MGYAKRARDAAKAEGRELPGKNPEPSTHFNVKFLSQDAFSKACKQATQRANGQAVGIVGTLKFSDRAYTVDAQGRFRRLAPAPVLVPAASADVSNTPNEQPSA